MNIILALTSKREVVDSIASIGIAQAGRPARIEHQASGGLLQTELLEPVALISSDGVKVSVAVSAWFSMGQGEKSQRGGSGDGSEVALVALNRPGRESLRRAPIRAQAVPSYQHTTVKGTKAKEARQFPTCWAKLLSFARRLGNPNGLSRSSERGPDRSSTSFRAILELEWRGGCGRVAHVSACAKRAIATR